MDEIEKLKYRVTALEDVVAELIKRLKETEFEYEDGSNLFSGLEEFALVKGDVR